MPQGTYTILIADDEENVRQSVAGFLRKDGYRLLFAATAEETRQKIAEQQPDLVLLDVILPDCKDLSLFNQIRSMSPGTAIVILSGNTENLAQVVEAARRGVYDWIPKPFDRDNVVMRVTRAIQHIEERRSQEFFLRERQDRAGLDSIIGGSEPICRIREVIRNVAETDFCVLIQGESGTGKELAARAIHNLSARKDAPFVVVNCAAIPEALVESVLFGHDKGAFTSAVKANKGKFEEAGNGTIFLDEIGDMPTPQQASFLHVLQSGTFTRLGESQQRESRARVIVATNQNLQALIKEKRFREDLYYRVKVAQITVPPLRERLTDIPAIVEHHCAWLTNTMGRVDIKVHPDVMKLFMQYDWPGNVRELHHCLDGCIAACGKGQTEVRVRDLPVEIQEFRSEVGASGNELPEIERQEKKTILNTLQQCKGNRGEAAKLLGLHRNTMTRRLRYYGIDNEFGRV